MIYMLYHNVMQVVSEDIMLDCIRNTESGKLAYNVYITAQERQVDLNLQNVMVGGILDRKEEF